MAKAKVANMSMKSKFAEADAEPMLRNLSAMKLQRWGRMLLVKRRIHHLYVLEDKVLLRPKPALLALKLLLPDSRPSSSASADPRRAAAERSEGRMESKASSGASSVTLSALAGHLEKSGFYPVTSPEKEPFVSSTVRAAQAIFSLLHVPRDGALQEKHLDRVYRHHRIHWRISMSKTSLRLILMRHGESSWNAQSVFSDSPGSPAAYRALRPEGWTQVTRTSWALRLCQDWQPHMLLSSSLACCRQTCERVCSMLNNPESGVPGAIEEGAKTLRIARCKALDFPDRVGGLGLSASEVGDAVREVVQEAEADSGEKLPRPKDVQHCSPPKILMFVTGGAAAESLMGYLTSGMKRKLLDQLLIGPGDAMLLESPPLHRLVGDGNEERVRADSELWQAALCRNQWHALYHIRGDGIGARPGALPMTVKESNADVARKIRERVLRPKFYDSSKLPEVDRAREVFSETREAFRRFAGEPMIFSHKEFSKLCWRAGKEEVPLESDFCAKVRPLVYGFKFSSPVASNEEAPG